MTANATSIAAVVPCHDAAETIGATVAALRGSTVPPDVIVCVDDASTDRTVAVVQMLASEPGAPIRLLSTEGVRGAAAARNVGARDVDTDLLLFIDADVVVAATAIAMLRERLRSGWSAVVAAHRPVSLRPGSMAHFQAALLHDAYASLDASDSPYFGTNCALIPRPLFLDAGGFDTTYSAATVEDFAFGRKLRARRHRIALETEAAVFHNHHYKARSFTTNYYRKARDLAVLDGVPRPGRAVGYCRPGHLASGALSLVATAAIAVGAVDERRRAAALGVVAGSAALLAAMWRPFLKLARAHGTQRVITFALLRWWVSCVGVAGGVAGVLARLQAGRHEGRSQPPRHESTAAQEPEHLRRKEQDRRDERPQVTLDDEIVTKVDRGALDGASEMRS